MRAIPGVESAALAGRLPFSIDYNRNNVFLPDRHGPEDKGLVLDVAQIGVVTLQSLQVTQQVSVDRRLQTCEVV